MRDPDRSTDRAAARSAAKPRLRGKSPLTLGAEAAALDSFGTYGIAKEIPGVSAGGREVGAHATTQVRTSVRTWLLLAGILAAAAVVRLWGLGGVGFNNDEAVYAGQGAALAGDPVDSGLFAIFRAHPLLVQFLFSIPFRVFGVNDVTPRLTAIAFGVAAVGLCYSTGSLLYNRRAGLIAAAVLAVMPYHVIVSRQALLDGPETTLFLLTIYLLARYSRDGAARWLYAAALSAGMTVLAKETAILIIPITAAYLLLTPKVKISLVRLLVALGIFVVAFGPYPAAVLIGKGTGAAQAFFLWEVLRQPNHTWTFYADILPGAMGPLIVLAAGVGLVLVVRRGRWQDRLLVAWIGVPIAFFEVWPVKGYQYLLPIAPAVTILVGLTFDRLLSRAQAMTAEAHSGQGPAGSLAGAPVRKAPDRTTKSAATEATPTLTAATEPADVLPAGATSQDAVTPDAAGTPATGAAAARAALAQAAARGAAASRAARARAVVARAAFSRVVSEQSRRLPPGTANRIATLKDTASKWRRYALVGASLALAITLGSVAVPTALAVNTTTMTSSLAGTGGLPGGRDAGLWIRDNVPQGATFLTIGPTLANIVEFYGQRQAYGLSVSPNPLRRNPAYDPINNPDRALQLNKIQYIATDIWSAQRSPYFDAALRKYLARYHGVLVYQQHAQVRDYSGAVTTQVVIEIYEVRP